MFLDPEGEVATAVEATIRDAAEVAHAGQSEVHELVQEVPHAFLAEHHAATDGHAFTQLERGDGLLGAGHHSLLSGNDGQFVHGLFHQLVVLAGRTEADVQRNFDNPGNLHGRAVRKLLLQYRDHFLAVNVFKTGHGGSPTAFRCTSCRSGFSCRPPRSGSPRGWERRRRGTRP